MQKVNEISTSRILHHLKDGTTFAIVSTFRGDRVKSNDGSVDADETLRMNMNLLRELKKYCRTNNHGFTEFVSRWSETNPDTGEIDSSDERALMIFGLSEEEAINLGKEYNQSSIIFKDETSCREICTNEFADWETGHVYKPGDTVRKFNVSSGNILNIDDAREIFMKRRGGPASMPVKGNRPFHLSETYMIEPARPSYFQRHETYIPIVKENNESSSLIQHWAQLAKEYKD